MHAPAGPDELVELTVRIDDPTAARETLTLINEYGLAGYGVISATPGPAPGCITVELAVQPEPVRQQMEVNIRNRLRDAPRDYWVGE